MDYLVKTALENPDSPSDLYQAHVLTNAGLMGNAIPWREQCTRVVLSFFPDSAYAARVWREGDDLGFQVHGQFSGSVVEIQEGERIVSMSALCLVLTYEQLRSLVASCAIRALDLAGYADVVDCQEYGGRVLHVTTDAHGKIACEDCGVVVGSAAEAFLREAEEAYETAAAYMTAELGGEE